MLNRYLLHFLMLGVAGFIYGFQILVGLIQKDSFDYGSFLHVGIVFICVYGVLFFIGNRKLSGDYKTPTMKLVKILLGIHVCLPFVASSIAIMLASS